MKAAVCFHSTQALSQKIDKNLSPLKIHIRAALKKKKIIFK